MKKNHQEKDLDELVEYKVRRIVAKKVIRDIQQQVDEIEQHEKAEYQSGRFVIPVLLVLSIIIFILLLI